MKASILSLLFVVMFPFATVYAQLQRAPEPPRFAGGEHVLFGDVRVDETKAAGSKPLLYEVVLYNVGNTIVGRQFVTAAGRYRFLNLANGQYELAVLVDGNEVARLRVEVMAPIKNDFRQDINLEWKSTGFSKPGTVEAADFHPRTSANEKLFLKAKESTDQKRYDDSIVILQQLVAADPHDFPAWTELGAVYLFKQNYDESEEAYLKAIAEQPSYFRALMNLGRLRYIRKKYDLAIEPLTKAVKIQPTSADANYYLGEAYLQIKKGSKAVGYLYEALKLDPIGRADVHLQLAALYNAAGYKDKAAIEYEEFLKKKPNYPDRKKIEQYITENKPATKNP
jgi:tetratricopeptide (TPR) repeat protein